MSETDTSPVTPLDIAKPSAKTPRPSGKPRTAKPIEADPDRFLMTAKALAVQNYNDHRNPALADELSMDTVHIIWFVKGPGNWKAVIASTAARGLLWEASYNSQRGEAYLDVYKKLTHAKIPMGDMK